MVNEIDTSEDETMDNGTKTSIKYNGFAISGGKQGRQ